MQRSVWLALGFFAGACAIGLAPTGEAGPQPTGGLVGQTPPKLSSNAECRRAEQPIAIDGKLGEPAWAKAELLPDFGANWLYRGGYTKTKARLLWDDEFLYFAAELEDADLYADVEQFNGMTWENDVFELFFKPKADSRHYYEFQVNAKNTRLELDLPSRGAGGYRRFARLSKLGMTSAVQLQGTLNDWKDKDTGWTVEGKIPWQAFTPTGGKPKPGDQWRFALCRYDYSTALEAPDLTSNARLTRPEFHRYEDYGTLTFRGKE